ncbi:MAG TPA: amino acid--tRNA ligase-related protein, partial [Myxococcaceae bacterium]|nr:amino acid--tRNA ligase-related protein [Myxococcaceae bacterium]
RVIDVGRAGSGWTALVLQADRPRRVSAPGELPMPRLGDLFRAEIEGERLMSLESLGSLESGEWTEDGDGLRWRHPNQSPTRMRLLWDRQTVLRAVREYLYGQGFLEVQTPLLVCGTTPDPAIDSVRVGDRYLVTSTEYQVKRMEVGGFDKLYTLTQNYRAGEVSALHNPEFTMLEWARAFGTLEAIERDAEAFTRAAFRALQPAGGQVIYRGRPVQLDGPEWERTTVREALARHLGLELDASFSLNSMRSEVRRRGVEVPPSFLEDRHLLFSFLMNAVGEKLGSPVPTFLRDWPAFQTSSAALRGDMPEVAERSELFIAGLEVADGFPSLRGEQTQRALFHQALERRAREGKEAVALDERYLEALRLGIPPGAGMALGFDRLVMALTGQEEIRNVLPFTWDEL